MKILSLLLVSFLLTLTANATSTYYPDQYQDGVSQLNDEELRTSLYELLTKKHVKTKKGNDILVNDCGEVNAGTCYTQRVLGYRGARKVLFGKLHLEQDSRGYFIRDVYCHKEITRSQTNVGPNIIPNGTIMNCEHTWPQSRFTGQFPRETQKSDLHHLYPTDSRANSIRGNFEFSNVNGEPLRNGCEDSKLGSSKKRSGSFFEPPSDHKGNVARALFYFAVRYKMKISSIEEKALRQWHNEDPVDAAEMERNDWIHKIQGNRNPFIDYPELVNQMADF